ncbi:glutaredoxin family protein [Butyrivibrio sp. LC3010]|uniref:glutaredoxin family protein n=1 Tax=Butyrivibrio sp. LC3010 TaxID=1280680 RepID=UPI000407A575|nr:glutaredoxin [Butyrivibrio sp. LC3010]
MDLKLFVSDTCGFCRRVKQYIDEVGRTDVEYVNISHSQEAADELVRVGGKMQVPCLFIDGNPMYESLDIIQWLKDNPQN